MSPPVPTVHSLVYIPRTAQITPSVPTVAPQVPPYLSLVPPPPVNIAFRASCKTPQTQGSKLKGKARREMLQKRERLAKNRQARSQIDQLVTFKRLSLTGRVLPGDRTAEVKAGPPVKYFGFARVRALLYTSGGYRMEFFDVLSFGLSKYRIVDTSYV